jgi:thioredoxin reductase (NADPH)
MERTSERRDRREASVRVVGYQWSPHAHEIKDFLARNRVPYRWMDIERDPEALETARRHDPELHSLPLVLFADGGVLAAPDIRALAARIGLDTEPDLPFYDLIVVGGGPAGLAAAVYGASEGVRTLVVERNAPGGQAGQSASIENYLGFPEGITGAELAGRAIVQAERFGAEILSARGVEAVRVDGDYRVVRLDDGRELGCHSVLLATGVSWRWLDAPGCGALVGAGIYYGAASAEAAAFRGEDVYLLGGGNSAGQAALLFARYARRVIMIVVERSLDETMSRYLVERIREAGNIVVRTGHTVAEATGDRCLRRLTITTADGERHEEVEAAALFVFIGGTPETEWLRDLVEVDEGGFILSAGDLARAGRRPRDWSEPRDPFLLETSIPGVLVAGDVRSGSVKRIASAVGEGAMAIHFVHQYLERR